MMSEISDQTFQCTLYETPRLLYEMKGNG